MRPFFILLACSCALSQSPAHAEKTFPYTAHITTDDVYVRSGPGQSYYPTDKLKAGQEVEVYRHDPGGWYAVRPPEGSFTWVSGRFIDLTGDNLAVVTDDRVAARVGSRFSTIRDVIQVRLNKAEVVEVLETKQTGTGTQRQTWYKIAPPSGEFRWVFGKYVDAVSSQDGLRRHLATNAPATTPTLVEEPKPDAVVAAYHEETTPIGPSSRSVQTPVVVQASATRVVPEAAWSGSPAAASRQITPEEYRTALAAIDIDLSIMIVEEPTVWAFDETRRRVEELLDVAQTAVERGHARVLLSKMARFEEIKRRYDGINQLRERTERVHRQLEAVGRTGSRATAPDERFDGVGQLTRVVSSKVGAPRYALVDGQGGVHCYLSPAPGLNLRHYVGRRVGINGTRGYMPEQDAHHIMAQHVRLLDAPTIR